MRILPTWLREFVDITADDRQLAEDLTSAGIAVESVEEENGATILRDGPDHQSRGRHESLRRGARGVGDLRRRAEAGRTQAACDRKPRSGDKSVTPPLRMTPESFPIVIEDAQGCARYTARIVRNVKIGPSPEHIVEASRTAGLALHQQRRRRHQLRAQRTRPSHARLRSRPARRRHDHRAPRARRRSAEDARRRRPQAHDRRPRHRRREEAGRAGRRDGRLRHHDHREDEERADRVGVVRSGDGPRAWPSVTACTPTPRIASSAAPTGASRRWPAIALPS